MVGVDRNLPIKCTCCPHQTRATSSQSLLCTNSTTISAPPENLVRGTESLWASPQPRRSPPTFSRREEALHLHAAPGVGDAQGTARHQAFLRGAPFRRLHQTPSGAVARLLQQLHRLAHLDAQLIAVDGDKILEHRGEFTASRQLQETRKRSPSNTSQQQRSALKSQGKA